MARFFLPPSEWSAPVWELRGDEAHHAAKVLRLRQGDACVVFDGRGRAALPWWRKPRAVPAYF